MEQIRSDWSLLKNQFEIDIIEKYAYYAKLITVFVMGKNSNQHADILIYHKFYNSL